MYGFDQDTRSESTFKSFPAGISSNVELDSVEFKSPKNDGSGDPAILFNFKGAGGETFRHVEFDIKGATDEVKASEYMGARIKHIVTKFVPEEQAVLSGSTFEEFANGVIKLLANSKGKKVFIKLTYGTAGYPKKNLGFPKFPNFIAVNAVDLSIAKTDLMEKPKAPSSPVDDIDLPTGGPTDEIPF